MPMRRTFTWSCTQRVSPSVYRSTTVSSPAGRSPSTRVGNQVPLEDEPPHAATRSAAQARRSRVVRTRSASRGARGSVRRGSSHLHAGAGAAGDADGPTSLADLVQIVAVGDVPERQARLGISLRDLTAGAVVAERPRRHGVAEPAPRALTV